MMGNQERRSRSTMWSTLGVLMAFVVVGGAWFWLSRGEQEPTAKQTAEMQETVAVDDAPVEPEASFDAEALQSVLDEWSITVGGTAGVTIMTTDGDVLAEIEGDKEYFTASIYKLYVAYAGYLQIDLGLVGADDIYLGGKTRGECLDLMIRESHSPCAETMWADLGKEQLTDQLATYGIENTSMVGLTTTAHDVAIMLAMIARGDNLSDASQAKLLDSMKGQIYRDTLNVGFSSDVTVYNKIGFREQDEYHDTAIVEFTDGRKLIVSVLTDGVGKKGIVDLGARIEASITQ